MYTNNLIPNDKSLDSSLALLREGYLFIRNRKKRYRSDIFKTHLMAKETICISGKDAAELFYDSNRFQRYNAAPKRIQKTLFGENAIQSMDGTEHLHRKNLFLSIVAGQNQKRLADIFMKQWQKSIGKWQGKRIALFEEAKNILFRSACHWAGVPLRESEVKKRADDFSAMVDAFGAVGPRHWRGRIARVRSEKWIGDIINDVRTGRLKPDKNSALYRMAFYEGLNNKRLDIKMAATELINVIRPIVAISTYITFLALALFRYPKCKSKLFADNNYLEMFVQEVRRFYPFTPFVGARVKNDFVWKNCFFKIGTLVILDVYGIDHDYRIWKNPYKFQPERFLNRDGSLYDFIPHGGGDTSMGHRCPGEGITVEIMKISLDFLVRKMEYDVPDQNISFSLKRMPSLPEDKFIIENIRQI